MPLSVFHISGSDIAICTPCVQPICFSAQLLHIVQKLHVNRNRFDIYSFSRSVKTTRGKYTFLIETKTFLHENGAISVAC